MDFTSRQLRGFHLVAQHQSFSRAAEALFITPSGLSLPSFGLPVARNRKVTLTQLINPVAHLEFHQISNRAKPLSPDAAEFTAFLKSYISRWAGRSGVL